MSGVTTHTPGCTHTPQTTHVIDATRILDGEMVMLKRVERVKYKHEVDIMKFFNTEPLKSHPKNHCVPLFEVLYPMDAKWTVMVMPHMRKFDNPEFETVGELVEFFRQLFEVNSFPH